MAAITRIPLRLSPSEAPSNEALRQILSIFMPKCWPLVDAKTLIVTKYTSFANAHCAVQRPKLINEESENEPSKLFLKMFHKDAPVIEAFKDLMPNKQDETLLCVEYAQSGWGARIFGFFVTEDGTMGRVEEFLDTRHLEPEDVEDPSLRADVAKALAAFHVLKGPTAARSPQDLIEEYYGCITGGLSKYQGLDKLKRLGREGGVNVDALVDYDFCSRLARITKELDSAGAKSAWCIHDVQYMNVLVKNDKNLDPGKHEGDEAQGQARREGGRAGRVRLIDFETTMRNYRGLDIGGHFMQKLFKWFDEESRIVKGCKAYSEEEKRHFCGEYVQQWNALTGDSDTQEQVFMEAEYGYMLTIAFDVHNMLYYMNKVDDKDALNLDGLNKLFDEFRDRFAKMGLEEG